MNIFRLSILFLLIDLSGCASREEPAQIDTQQIDTQMNANAGRLERAAENAKISCQNKQSCDKAFGLAEVFVKENADTTIQFSDDTIVSTFNPIAWGKMGLTASKTLEAGDSATIKLVASCKGINTNINNTYYIKCVEKVENAYLKFKPFIESRLQSLH
jgi:hypothetical protein